MDSAIDVFYVEHREIMKQNCGPTLELQRILRSLRPGLREPEDPTGISCDRLK